MFILLLLISRAASLFPHSFPELPLFFRPVAKGINTSSKQSSTSTSTKQGTKRGIPPGFRRGADDVIGAAPRRVSANHGQRFL
ncbi:hypothetical protein F4775DRAFT_163094 [Biscogniauxia sp. FL1348]|nr:hypothetical protein F4775DRAFT_163094 [Biscogniauxia sp. FL1348]